MRLVFYRLVRPNARVSRMLSQLSLLALPFHHLFKIMSGNKMLISASSVIRTPDAAGNRVSVK